MICTALKTNKNYYQILHVQPEAPLEVIRSSYRTMMQKLKMHPDLGGDQKDAALLNEAYAVLTNPNKRAEYDINLKNAGQDERVPTNESNQDQHTSREFNQTNYAEQCIFCQHSHYLGASIHPDSLCANCDSPLFPIKKQPMGKYGERAIQRIGKKWPVNFYTEWNKKTAHNGISLNVSLHGILLLTTNSLTNGQIIKITGKPLDCIAKVSNQQINSSDKTQEWRTGLEFLTLQLHNTQGTFVSLSI